MRTNCIAQGSNSELCGDLDGKEIQKEGICCYSVTKLCATPWTPAPQACLSTTVSWSLPKFMSIELVMPSNRLTCCCPLLLLPLVFPSISVWGYIYIYICMYEKEMATHSSIAWKIPRTEEPDGLQSKGSQRVRHGWVTECMYVAYLLYSRNEHNVIKQLYSN